MIFAKITKTLDGFDCHYFGTRESFGRHVHCFAIFSPQIGVQEVQYDDDGNRLRFENGKWVKGNTTNYQIVEPRRKVEVTRWICFKNVPTDIQEPIAVHLWDREPSNEQIEAAKYFEIEKRVWVVEVPE